VSLKTCLTNAVAAAFGVPPPPELAAVDPADIAEVVAAAVAEDFELELLEPQALIPTRQRLREPASIRIDLVRSICFVLLSIERSSSLLRIMWRECMV
jgi:hypothetical protein